MADNDLLPTPPGAVSALQRRILVVEDSDAFRVLMMAGLSAAGFEVAGAPNAQQALIEHERFDPDAAIIDVDLGHRPNGIELSRLLLHKAPYLRVVFLTSFPHPPGLRDYEASQPTFGFLLKSDLDSMDTLLTVLDSTMRGQPVVTGSPAGAGVRLADRLTPAQLEVLWMVAAGWSNQKISMDRACTVRSVERILDRIYALLELDGVDESNMRVLAAQAYSREYGFPGFDREQS